MFFALLPVAELFLSRLLLPRRSQFAFFFFFFLAFSKVSGPCSDCWRPELLEGLAGGVTDNLQVVALDCVFSGCSWDPLNINFRGQLPRGHRWSRCWLLWMWVLASALFAVMTNSSQDRRSRPISSIHNFIEGLSPS